MKKYKNLPVSTKFHRIIKSDLRNSKHKTIEALLKHYRTLALYTEAGTFSSGVPNFHHVTVVEPQT